MQAFLSLPALALYVIIATVLIAGWLVMRREIRLDRQIEPDYQPRHELPGMVIGAADGAHITADTPPDPDQWPDGIPWRYPDPAPGAPDDFLAMARAHWTAAELGQWEVVNETWDFQRWEAEQDAHIAAARQAAAAVREALDSGQWADPWWTRHYSTI